MESILSIKNRVKICLSVLLLLLISCESKTDRRISLKKVIYEYVDILNVDKLEEKPYLIRVEEESNKDYKAYRIYLTFNLLDKTEIPHRIDQYKNAKIAIFEKSLLDSVEIKNMIESLGEKGFFNIKSKYYRSRYPEWFFLKNKKSEKSMTIKEMSFSSLDSIIDKYKSKLE